jgi:hypothetical protein
LIEANERFALVQGRRSRTQAGTLQLAS